jgi:polysaccharide export outer membrane protein
MKTRSSSSTPSYLSRLLLVGAAVCLLVPQTTAAAEDLKPGQTSTERDYVIGPGDKLRIEVYKDAQLSQSLQVRPDGKITMPLIGDLEATGLAPIALRDVIAKRLKEYVTNPVVTVIVVEASAATAYVVGEVNSPGAVTLQGGQLTVLQALALAGGLKDFANSKNIRILRKSITGTQTIDFNYKEAIRGNGQPVYLRPGDTVVVPD